MPVQGVMVVAMLLRLLGEVRAEIDGRPVDLGAPRQRCVLAALAVDAGRVVPVERLVERVWGADVAPRARTTLHGYLSRLRSALADADGVAIKRRSSGYALVTDTAEPVVDLHRFRDLCARARGHDCQAAQLLTEALALWQGEALTGVDGEWVQAERYRLEQERLVAQHDLVDARLRAGDGGRLLVELAERARVHPLDERIAGQYMLALHQTGRTADALEHYRQTRMRLVEELGTDPGALLEEVYRQVLTADTAPTSDLIASTVDATVPRQLPTAPVPFTGRVTELVELDRIFTTSSRGPLSRGNEQGMEATVMISTIGGTGGVGKTWLALTWAYRHQHRFPDGQLFADLRGFSSDDPERATDVLARFLIALGVEPNQQPQDLDARAALFRSHTAGKRMLILLDNAATPEQIVPLLPGGDSCTVLITSRHRLPALLARHGAYPIHLDVLDDAEARTLLATAIGGGTRDAQSAITELIGVCRGFPLALGVIAARIRTHPNLLEDIVTELRDLGLRALESDDADVSLPTVLSWSLRHLTDQQRTLFGLLGIAPGPDITLPAVAALTALPPTAARKALSALEEASLLERRRHGRYGMHDLVRDYAATTAQYLSCDVREAALVRVVDFHLHTAHHASHLLEPHGQFAQPSPPAPGVHPHPLPNAAAASTWLDAEHASLLSSQRAAAALGRHHVVWHLAWALDTYHARRRHLRDSLAAWRNALDAAAHLPDHAARIHAHRLLGRVCARLGLHDDATGHLNRALDLAERHHDPTQRAFAHRALALAWGRQGDDQRALDHARHALDLFRTLDRPTWEADALTSVGWYAARLGNFHTARDHCRAALTLNRRHRDVEGEAITLDKLGLIAHRTGDHAQAVDHYHQSLALFRALSHTSQVPNILDSVGHPLVAVGQHDRARNTWSEALELYREQGRDTDAQRVQQQLDDLEALTGIDSGRT